MNPKFIIKYAINKFGYDLRRFSPKDVNLSEHEKTFKKLLELHEYILNPSFHGLEQSFIKFCIDKATGSKAQLLQDLFVLFILMEKRNGYFVEFGAGNGFNLSNTYLLENEYSWSGILAEPARCWHSDLVKNRKCKIDYRCVWGQSKSVLEFNEVEDLPEFSTIKGFTELDKHHAIRKARSKFYQVETITLDDLLAQNGAPKNIDFLSIDTEGSEFEIIKCFHFENYNIKTIAIEHNYTHNREKIFNHLSSHGYIRVLETLSAWDDWYISRELMDTFRTNQTNENIF